MIWASKLLGVSDGLTDLCLEFLGFCVLAFLGYWGFEALNCHRPAAKSHAFSDGFCEALFCCAGEAQSVGSNVDIVPQILLEYWWVIEFRFSPVDSTVKISLLDKCLEQVCVGSLTSADSRRPYRYRVPFETPEHIVNYLLDRSSGNFIATIRAVWEAYSGPK
jgi:hypothetical protein